MKRKLILLQKHNLRFRFLWITNINQRSQEACFQIIVRWCMVELRHSKKLQVCCLTIKTWCLVEALNNLLMVHQNQHNLMSHNLRLWKLLNNMILTRSLLAVLNQCNLSQWLKLKNNKEFRSSSNSNSNSSISNLQLLINNNNNIRTCINNNLNQILTLSTFQILNK